MLESVSGEVVRLSDFRGKSPVLIVFWATWCGYCRKEIPKINHLRAQYRREELAILAIDLEEPKEKVKAYAEQMGMNYDVLLDYDAQVTNLYGVQGVPTFFLVAKDGSALVYSHRLTPQVLAAISENI